MPEGGGVPRGTPPPSVVPAAAADVFGERVELAAAYVAYLADAGVERGLIGPREVPRLWSRHLLNCAYLHELIPQDASVIDVGSGAGLPGIPVALARPDLQIRLVEPLERRFHFLREVVAELGLRDQVAVVRGRAEDVAGEFSAPIVTARAVAPLATLYGWTMPLVQTEGSLLAIKGRSAPEEIEAAGAALKALGITTTPEVVHCGPDDETGTTVVRVGRGTGPLRKAPVAGAPAKKKPARGSARGARQR
ncbi:16S rRNA (guanine(527)-N(7))-methyltransferase RsmG [Kineococcus rubinsiae]|uniref:16S rRNA (guanine(527)-N(7))-methyltransferase RsmG n=1 Tax=Kineococcus rubinsiae TaxID=2609562 RepID=UPI00142FECBA|nr:16S rRNA (guanine(527)-N(7))-methyltransferase RsmG [Kineococcus rubinsiae]